ncbi:MAG TPA: fibronectin type III domain-containing protein, partial [Blastocatellia bacterium]|nr:fibronectin type III domain-containing protein [Blastocatellia bacterium]
ASPLNTSMVTTHSVTLTGLTASRLYHYRVKSKDASGNQGVSGDFTFTTSSGGGGGGGGGGSSTQNVAWTNLVNVAATGNSLRNNVAANGGATSVQRIESGNGYVEFTATETNTYRWAGLSNGDSGTGYEDVDFAINLTSNAHSGGFIVNIHENGVYKGDTIYSSGDVFRVAVEGGAVKYYKNGSLIYTSARTPVYPLIVDTSFGEVGATITNAKISGDSGLADLKVPMLFDSTMQLNASMNLIDWLMIGRREHLFFGRRFEQS